MVHLTAVLGLRQRGVQSLGVCGQNCGWLVDCHCVTISVTSISLTTITSKGQFTVSTVSSVWEGDGHRQKGGENLEIAQKALKLFRFITW